MDLQIIQNKIFRSQRLRVMLDLAFSGTLPGGNTSFEAGGQM